MFICTYVYIYTYILPCGKSPAQQLVSSCFATDCFEQRAACFIIFFIVIIIVLIIAVFLFNDFAVVS